jgi:hypothetical protein
VCFFVLCNRHRFNSRLSLESWGLPIYPGSAFSSDAGRSPWRQLLSLPIPYHVHWPRYYCQSPANPPAICGKPCFRGPSGCMRGAGAFGPFLRAGCAGAEWVRGGSLGSGMRAGRRCLASRVGGVRWAGSLPATRTRVLVALAGTWRAGRHCVFPQCGVGHASALGLVRRPVAILGLLRWSQSGAYRCCCMRGRYCAERSLTMHTLRIARSSAHLRVPIEQACSPMPRNLLLPTPPARPCTLLLDVCRALHTKHALVVKT